MSWNFIRRADTRAALVVKVEEEVRAAHSMVPEALPGAVGHALELLPLKEPPEGVAFMVSTYGHVTLPEGSATDNVQITVCFTTKD